MKQQYILTITFIKPSAAAAKDLISPDDWKLIDSISVMSHQDQASWNNRSSSGRTVEIITFDPAAWISQIKRSAIVSSYMLIRVDECYTILSR